MFDKRAAFKPFEYPELSGFKDAINHSYWLVSEWSFAADTDDFRVGLTSTERAVIRNALLAISQVEVSVKKFWGRLGDRLPKPEFEQVGATFAESEVRHADAYSHLLEVLGLNQDFASVLDVPAIQGRVAYLAEAMAGNRPGASEREYAHTLALFSLFVENVSLFSQFAIIKSVNKHRNLLKDVDNVVQATQQEEQVHALFGSTVVNMIKDENPKWFDSEFYAKVNAACSKAFEAESRIIDWIFEAGDLPYLSARSVKEFAKARFNESLALIAAPPAFSVNPVLTGELRWFDEELHAGVSTDFFHKRPTTYSKNTQSVTAEDLF